MTDMKFDICLGLHYDVDEDLYAHECIIPSCSTISLITGEVLLPQPMPKHRKEAQDAGILYFSNDVTIPTVHFDRIIHRYIINSNRDLDRVQQEHPHLDLNYIKQKLDDPEIRMRYGSISLMIIDGHPIRFQKKLEEIGRISPEDTWQHIKRYISEDGYNITISSHFSYIEKLLFVDDDKVRYEEEYTTKFIRTYYKKDLEVSKRNWSYRLYINDRVLIERPFELQLSFIRWYQEIVILSSIPKQGYNFRLETPLNLRIMAVKVNEEKLELTPGVLSFSL